MTHSSHTITIDQMPKQGHSLKEFSPEDYKGPFLFGGPAFLELARRAGYPEYMLRESKPIPYDED